MGVVRESRKIEKFLGHCAVIFAIAQLSCLPLRRYQQEFSQQTRHKLMTAYRHKQPVITDYCNIQREYAVSYHAYLPDSDEFHNTGSVAGKTDKIAVMT